MNTNRLDEIRERLNKRGRIDIHKVYADAHELLDMLDTARSAYSDLLVNSMNEIGAQRAKLDAIGELPERWRTTPTDYLYEKAFKEGMQYCAGNLKSILDKP